MKVLLKLLRRLHVAANDTGIDLKFPLPRALNIYAYVNPSAGKEALDKLVDVGLQETIFPGDPDVNVQEAVVYRPHLHRYGRIFGLVRASAITRHAPEHL